MSAPRPAWPGSSGRRLRAHRRRSAGGFLASFDAIALYLDLSPDERSAYTNLSALFNSVYGEFRRAAPEASWADWSRHAVRHTRPVVAPWPRGGRCDGLLSFTHAKRRALRSLLERHRDSKVLVFTADNDTAYAIAREHLIMPLTCDINRPERDDVLGRFRCGDLRDARVGPGAQRRARRSRRGRRRSSSGAPWESVNTCNGSAGCCGRARASGPPRTSWSHGTPSRSVRRGGGAAALLPDRPISYSVGGDACRPSLPWGARPSMVALPPRGARAVHRTAPARSGCPPARATTLRESPGKLSLAIQVLARLQRGRPSPARRAAAASSRDGLRRGGAGRGSSARAS